MNAPIKAVIFDMDGLLLDTEQVYLSGFRKARDVFGLPPDDELFMQLIGLPLHASNAIVEQALHGVMDIAAFDSQWNTEVRALLDDHIPVKPGVTQTLQTLTAHDIPFAIATSTKTERALDHLDRAGIGHHFENVIGGDQVRNGKPSPDIYLKAAAILRMPSQECAAFEDSENGVRAAVTAGMKTVQVPDLKHPDDDFRALGHHVAPSLIAGMAHLGFDMHDTQ